MMSLLSLSVLSVWIIYVTAWLLCISATVGIGFLWGTYTEAKCWRKEAVDRGFARFFVVKALTPKVKFRWYTKNQVKNGEGGFDDS